MESSVSDEHRILAENSAAYGAVAVVRSTSGLGIRLCRDCPVWVAAHAMAPATAPHIMSTQEREYPLVVARIYSKLKADVKLYSLKKRGLNVLDPWRDVNRLNLYLVYLGLSPVQDFAREEREE